jgi:hypothetical protein
VKPRLSGRAPSGRLAVAATAASVLAIAVLAGMRPSPFVPPHPVGGGPVGPFAAMAQAVGLDRLSATTAAVTGLVVMGLAVLAFLLALREAWRGRVSVRGAVALAVAFQVAMLLVPVLLSRDVYSYAMYGRIAGVYHANPYVATPIDFRHDALFPVVGPVWRREPSVYGPAFTMLSAVLARVVSSPAGLAWAFKLLAAGAGVGTVFLIARVAGRLAPGRAAFAVGLFGWNPVVVAYGAGGGHNDLIVALFVAGALAALVGPRREDPQAPSGDGAAPRERPWAALVAVALLTLATLVKVSAAPALLLSVVGTVGARPRGRRLPLLAAEAAVVLVLVVGFAAPYWQTTNPTLGIASLATHRGWVTPTRLLLATLGGIGENLWGAAGRTAVEAVVRVAMTGVAVTGLGLVALAVWRRALGDGPLPRSSAADGAAWGWAFLVFVLASPVLLPWYVAWVFPVAWLLPRTERWAVVGLSAVLALSHSIAQPGLVPSLYSRVLLLGHDVIGPVLLAILVWTTVRLVRAFRTRARLEDAALLPAGRPPSQQVAARSHAG